MTNYFRFWRVQDGVLVSPFTLRPMPLDGLLVTTTPTPFGRDGIHVYATGDEARVGAGLLPEPSAITEGIVYGLVLAETHTQPYQVGDRWVSIPMGKRVAKYQVTAIYTNQRDLTAYGIPLHTLDSLA